MVTLPNYLTFSQAALSPKAPKGCRGVATYMGIQSRVPQNKLREFWPRRLSPSPSVTFMPNPARGDRAVATRPEEGVLTPWSDWIGGDPLRQGVRVPLRPCVAGQETHMVANHIRPCSVTKAWVPEDRDIISRESGAYVVLHLRSRGGQTCRFTADVCSSTNP